MPANETPVKDQMDYEEKDRVYAHLHFLPFFFVCFFVFKNTNLQSREQNLNKTWYKKKKYRLFLFMMAMNKSSCAEMLAIFVNMQVNTSQVTQHDLFSHKSNTIII